MFIAPQKKKRVREVLLRQGGTLTTPRIQSECCCEQHSKYCRNEYFGTKFLVMKGEIYGGTKVENTQFTFYILDVFLTSSE